MKKYKFDVIYTFQGVKKCFVITSYTPGIPAVIANRMYPDNWEDVRCYFMSDIRRQYIDEICGNKK